jgi:hypothetical protein
MGMKLGFSPGETVFESRVIRWVFGPKREEVAVDLRKLRNVELQSCTLDQILCVFLMFPTRATRPAHLIQISSP